MCVFREGERETHSENFCLTYALFIAPRSLEPQSKKEGKKEGETEGRKERERDGKKER